MIEIVRVGVIGCGVMGQHHLRMFKRIPSVELVGVVDIDRERARQAADLVQAQPFYDYRQLLDLKPDVVDVVVPTSAHEKIAVEAVEAGCHIIVEKPLADSLESGKAIVTAAREKRRKLMVGHIERFNPAVLRLKEAIMEGSLGDIVSAHSRRAGPYSPRTYDVGVILDLGTHDIDVISYLYGERVKQVHAVAASELHRYEDHATLLLQFENGRSGVVEVNWLVPYKIRELSLIGLKGVGMLNFIQQQVRLLDKHWSTEMKVKRGEPLFLELRHFIDTVREDKEPAVSAEDSLHALAVALKAAESAQQGKEVALSRDLWSIDDADLSLRR